MITVQGDRLVDGYTTLSGLIFPGGLYRTTDGTQSGLVATGCCRGPYNLGQTPVSLGFWVASEARWAQFRWNVSERYTGNGSSPVLARDYARGEPPQGLRSEKFR